MLAGGGSAGLMPRYIRISLNAIIKTAFESLRSSELRKEISHVWNQRSKLPEELMPESMQGSLPKSAYLCKSLPRPLPIWVPVLRLQQSTRSWTIPQTRSLQPLLSTSLLSTSLLSTSLLS
ncbi:uncharacterized protein LOC143768537 [Ranitomeya variabilis]|uniref:uncharacterized protein LOC143768537 n=1 Tax=Ranitomeya variabilis TaxID=490064 RepID=UPI0040560EF3